MSNLIQVDILKGVSKAFPNKPGVYVFFDKQGKANYVGKAKNLKKRVAYYFKFEQLPKRLVRMVNTSANLQCFITATEQDALLLEAQFIKEKQPIYNILYKAGRSLYYLGISQHEFSKVEIKNEWSKGFVGPFLSVENINFVLNDILKIFKLRTCSDYVFAHRKRPCLEYYSNRCTAPCVGKIEANEYENNVQAFVNFFHGKNAMVIKQWQKDLKQAIQAERFETAAEIRDRITLVEKLHWKQNIHFENVKKLDVVVAYNNDKGKHDGFHYFYVELIRNGAVVDIQYRKYEKKLSVEEFLWEFYDSQPTHKVIVQKSKMNKLEKQIYENAQKRMHSLIDQENKALSWAYDLGADSFSAIEVYDSSHYNSKHALCGMVFYDGYDFIKNRYRYWKLDKNSANDLEILESTLQRRLKAGNLPTIMLLDGGPTQLRSAHKILRNEAVLLIAFAKGENRKGGKLYKMIDEKVVEIVVDSQLKLVLEKLRDEAHRWAKKHASKAYTKNFVQKI